MREHGLSFNTTCTAKEVRRAHLTTMLDFLGYLWNLFLGFDVFTFLFPETLKWLMDHDTNLNISRYKGWYDFSNGKYYLSYSAKYLQNRRQSTYNLRIWMNWGFNKELNSVLNKSYFQLSCPALWHGTLYYW